MSMTTTGSRWNWGCPGLGADPWLISNLGCSVLGSGCVPVWMDLCNSYRWEVSHSSPHAVSHCSICSNVGYKLSCGALLPCLTVLGIRQWERESKNRAGAICPSGFKGEINKNECAGKERRDVWVWTCKRKAPHLWSGVICEWWKLMCQGR